MRTPRSQTLEWFRARLAGESANPRAEEILAPTWRSAAMGHYAVEMNLSLAPGSTVEDTVETAAGEAILLLRDGRGRHHELLLSFESPTSGRITRLCLRPRLASDIVVRSPAPADIERMRELELAAPVRRDDGTEVVIDHNCQQFEHHRVLRDHRWLAAFEDDRMVAVQGVALAEAPIAGTMYRIAYNHYSRSDPGSRNSGKLLHLISTLYRDIYPVIDQFISIVDVRNAAGLRLSFGAPSAKRLRRLFLSVHDLIARQVPPPALRTFDAAHAAALLNATHAGMDFWVPRTPEFLLERVRRAPGVYGPETWRLAAHAALAIWPSGERRTYRRDGQEIERTLALVLDYACVGLQGRDELIGLLTAAAPALEERGITHLALFVSDDHPPTQWLAELAEAADIYVVCSPELATPPLLERPLYVDHILF